MFTSIGDDYYLNWKLSICYMSSVLRNTEVHGNGYEKKWSQICLTHYDKECTGHDPVLCSYCSGVSKRCTPRCILVLIFLYVCLELSVLCLVHGWIEEVEAMAIRKAASPASCPPAQSSPRHTCSLWSFSHSPPLKFSYLQVNGFHAKE